jgi:FkbH-like protein
MGFCRYRATCPSRGTRVWRAVLYRGRSRDKIRRGSSEAFAELNASAITMTVPDTSEWNGLDVRARLQATRGLPPERAVAILAPAIGELQECDWALMRAVLARVDEAVLALDPAWTAADSPWARSPMGRWLLAETHSSRGRKTEALDHWDRIIASGGPWLAEALLARARLHRDLGNIPGAFLDLRSAALGRHDFSFLTKAARLFDRLAQKERPPGRPIRIALLSSCTSDLLAPLLRLAFFREGLCASLYVGPFGNQRQEVLDPASRLYGFAPEVLIIGTNWHDAGLAAFTADPNEAVDMLWTQAGDLWRAVNARHPCTILQHGFDLPFNEAAGYLAAGEAGGRLRVLRAFNTRLWAERPANVRVVDLEGLAAEVGAAIWEDPSQWFSNKQHPGPGALPRLADQYCRLVVAGLGMAKKVLVLDLDNTLWAGIVGEDGVEGLQVGPPSAIGEAHLALQHYAKELKERGVLLAVCSKNNDADARAPFRLHDGMILREDDFVAFVANWRDKSENLREMATTLGLGLDSFVFLDDNPVERERMRRELPEVAVVAMGPDPAGYVASLQATGWFESVAISGEDRRRHLSYQANSARSAAQEQAPSLESFLQGLRMRIQHGNVGEHVVQRVAQLLGKTNQFNLTSRRHGIETIRQMACDPTGWTQYFRLADCFGDSGIVGAVIAIPSEREEATWDIDTFLLSCRVIGRGVEGYMLRATLVAAKAAGVKRVRGLFLPSAKNAPAAQLYPRFGFALEAGPTTAGSSYVWDVDFQRLPDVPFIERVTDELQSA